MQTSELLNKQKMAETVKDMIARICFWDDDVYETK